MTRSVSNLLKSKLADSQSFLDQPHFDADDNWLKNLTLRVKNVGTKPIAFFNIGGGLFRRMDEALAWDESYQYVLGWELEEREIGLSEIERPKRRGLKPGESVELNIRQC